MTTDPVAVRTGGLSTTHDRILVHAEALAREGRSPLSVILLDSAADDLRRGAVVAELYDGAGDASGPCLRLLAALHFLVLSGSAPELAA